MHRSIFQTVIPAVLALVAGSASAAVCHVVPDGDPVADGDSWATPTVLQAALGRSDCTEIWLGEGVHVPAAAGDRTASFRVPPGVAIYGGFAGTESAREERDPVAHRSVLSGDIDGNDVRDEDGVTLDADDVVGDNSYHVVMLDGTTAAGPIGPDTVLDGLTITAGHAAGNYPDDAGAGMYCNGAWAGARCEPTLTHLRFMGNLARDYGAALYLQADTYGGGASPTISDTLFSGNEAGRFGGAIFIKANSGSSASPLIERTTFTANRADQGGAIYNSAGAQQGIAAMHLENVTFDGNDASIGDAYSGNGGAIHNEGVGGNAHITLRHVTVSDNTARGTNHFGGGLVNRGSHARTTVENSILWGNSASNREQVYSTGGGVVEIADSLVQDGCPVGVTCTDLVDGDPVLAPLGDNGGLTPTRLPARYGAAIDAGADAACTATDQRGLSRPQGEACDLGAVELLSRRCHVDQTATGSEDGNTWVDAYTDLQAALGNESCDEIWVARGVYTPVTPVDPENVSPEEQATSFSVRSGVALYGGFAGDETSRDESDPLANPTVLSGDIDGNDAADADGVVADADGIEGVNSFHVVRLDGTAGQYPISGATRLEGFIITAGAAVAGAGVDNTGGGLLCDGSGNGGSCGPSLARLRFIGNVAGHGGGAVAIRARDHGVASPAFRNVVFRGNAGVNGGAVHHDAFGEGGRITASFRDIAFIDNSGSSGGAITNRASGEGARISLQLVNGTFIGNHAIFAIVMDNRADDSGVVEVAMQHTTMIAATADSGAVVRGDAYPDGAVSLELANSIVWGPEGAAIENRRGAVATVRASILGGGCQPGDGNDCSDVVDADPLLGPLVGADGFTPVLLPGAGSAALDAGDVAFCSDADQRGVPRPQGGQCDMGAVEVRGPRLDVSVDGAVGRATLVSPLALVGAIDCTQADAGSCSARFSSEDELPVVELAVSPTTHHVASVVADCAVENDLPGAAVRVTMPADGCEVSLGWEPNRVEGEVIGLAGSGLVLHLDAGDEEDGELLAADDAGAFAFDTAVAAGNTWTVTVATEPTEPAQICSVSDGSGTMAPGGASGVTVTCEDVRFPLSGSITGLIGNGLRVSLQSDDTLVEELTVPAGSVAFQFEAELLEGQDFSVAISGQPVGPSQTCVLDGSTSGTVPEGGIDDLVIDCTTDRHAIGGMASGLDGPGLVLQLNGDETLAIDADGSFQFETQVESGEAYAVTLLASPPWRTCTLDQATGVVGDSDVQIGVDCVEDAPVLALGIDDGRDFARYGQVVDYVVMLENSGGIARDVDVRFSLSDGFDGQHAQWTCIGAGAGAACEQDVADPLHFTVTLPPERALVWLVGVPVSAQSTAESVEFGASVASAEPVVDVNTLVIFRNGFDRAYADGAEHVVTGPQARAFLAGEHMETILVPEVQGVEPVVLWRVRGDGGSVWVDAWHSRDSLLVRLRRAEGDSVRISPWAEVNAGSTLVFGAMAGNDGMPPYLLLEGTRPGLGLQ